MRRRRVGAAGSGLKSKARRAWGRRVTDRLLVSVSPPKTDAVSRAGALPARLGVCAAYHGDEIACRRGTHAVSGPVSPRSKSWCRDRVRLGGGVLRDGCTTIRARRELPAPQETAALQDAPA